MVEEKENRIRAETETRKLQRIEDFDSMLTDKTDAYHKVISDDPEAQKLIDKAKDLFLPKTTLENLKSLYKGATITAFFTNGVSVATGFSAPYFLIKTSLPDLGEEVTSVFAGAVSLAGLALVEWGKRETAENFAVPLFREKKIKPGWLIAMACFTGISVYASVNGARMFVEQSSAKVSEAGALSKTRADSVARFWDGEMAAAEALAVSAKDDANKFLAANMVTEGGEKVFSANTNVKKAYAKLENRAAEARDKAALLRDRKNDALAKEEGKAEISALKAEAGVKESASGMMIFSSFIEALCVASLFFRYHFFARIYAETLGLISKAKAKAGEKKNGATGEPVGDPLPEQEQDDLTTNKPTMTWAKSTNTESV